MHSFPFVSNKLSFNLFINKDICLRLIHLYTHTKRRYFNEIHLVTSGLNSTLQNKPKADVQYTSHDEFVLYRLKQI